MILKPVFIIVIVFSITIALVGVVAMTNTTDTTSAANNTPAANNAGLTANQLANNAAADKAYNAAISKEYAQSNQPDTEIRFGDPDYVYVTEEEAAASKAATAKMHEVAERVRATADLREEKRERDKDFDVLTMEGDRFCFNNPHHIWC